MATLKALRGLAYSITRLRMRTTLRNRQLEARRSDTAANESHSGMSILIITLKSSRFNEELDV
jgi:hypothetical protein